MKRIISEDEKLRMVRMVNDGVPILNVCKRRAFRAVRCTDGCNCTRGVRDGAPRGRLTCSRFTKWNGGSQYWRRKCKSSERAAAGQNRQTMKRSRRLKLCVENTPSLQFAGRCRSCGQPTISGKRSRKRHGSMPRTMSCVLRYRHISMRARKDSAHPKSR